jgi:hypothetical protein
MLCPRLSTAPRSRSPTVRGASNLEVAPPGPYVYSGYVKFFYFISGLTKPNSPASLFLTLRKYPHRHASPARPAWSPRTSGPGTLWLGERLLLRFCFSQKIHYFSLQKQKIKPKNIPTFELCLTVSFFFFSCLLRQLHGRKAQPGPDWDNPS